MKKLVTAITAFLYLLLTTGVAVKVHYCMGQVDSVSFSVTATEVCGRCGMHGDDADGCCKDDVHFYKVDDTQKAGGQPGAAAVVFAVLPPPVYQQAEPGVLTRSADRDYFSDTSPPPLLKDQYIFNCVLRI